MSCNTKTSLAAVIDAVNAQLNNNYVDRDDPRINEGVFTNPTIRGGLMLDEAAKLDFCGYVTECGQREPFGKQWVDRPLYPDNMLVSYDDAGEIKSKWQSTNDVIAGSDLGESHAALIQDIDSAGGLDKLANAQVAVNTLADLVAANWLKVGMVVSTKGYYTANDGGGNDYEIVAADTGVVDGGAFINLTSTNLQAKGLFKNGVVSVLQFGAQPNVQVDQVTKIQNAINYAKNLTFGERGVFYISAVGVAFKSGQTIECRNSGLELLAHDLNWYRIMQLQDVQDVTLNNPSCNGRRDLNSAVDGEWGMGLSILGAKNITINNPVTKNCWGDGVYVSGSPEGLTYSDNVTINNLSSDNDRRQGISVISAKDLTIYEPRINNVNGTNPQAGIDLEPDDNTNVLENIKIIRPVITNCVGSSIEVHLRRLAGTVKKEVSIFVDSPTEDNCGGISVGYYDPRIGVITGDITFVNPTIKSPRMSAFHSVNYGADGAKVVLLNPIVSDSNTANELSNLGGSVFSIYADEGFDYDIGGIDIINPRVGKPRFPVPNFLFASHTNASYKVRNVSMLEPLYIHPDANKTGLVRGEVKVLDRLGAWRYSLLGSITLDISLFSGVINTGLASVITLPATFVKGAPDIVLESADTAVTVRPAVGASIVGQVDGTYLGCNGNRQGNLLVLRNMGGGKYLVVSKSDGWEYSVPPEEPPVVP